MQMTITELSYNSARKRPYTKTAKTRFACKVNLRRQGTGLHENGGDKLFRIIEG